MHQNNSHRNPQKKTDAKERNQGWPFSIAAALMFIFKPLLLPLSLLHPYVRKRIQEKKRGPTGQQKGNT